MRTVNERRTILTAVMGTIVCLAGCQSPLESFRTAQADRSPSRNIRDFQETAATVLNRHRRLTGSQPPRPTAETFNGLRHIGASNVMGRTPQPIASPPLNLRAVPASAKWRPFVDSEAAADATSDERQLKPVEFRVSSKARVLLLPPPAPPAEDQTPSKKHRRRLKSTTGSPQPTNRQQVAPISLSGPPSAPIPNRTTAANHDSATKTPPPTPLIPPVPLPKLKTDEPEPTDELLTARYDINLPTVLRLAGADNWEIQLATERIYGAQSRLLAARALWLPSLNAGLGYTKHDGRIQATTGSVINVSRNSFFLGGGAGLGGSPIAGGSGGPARLQVDLSLADALFKPLAAKQRVRAAEADETVTFNDTLLSASLAYYDLVEAQTRLTITREILDKARNLLKQTKAFVAAGKGSPADIARAQVEVSNRRQIEVQAELAIQVASAELARILQLDPEKLETGTQLYPLEGTPAAVELVGEDSTLDALIAQGQTVRPEVDRAQAELEARRMEVTAERWRPFIPNLHIGVSAGGFGGGVNSNLNSLDGRSDVDILAVWQLKNLGLGLRADRQEKSSRYRQALLANYRLGDMITADVTKAYYQVHAQRERLSLAATTIDQAMNSYDKNLSRIRSLEGLPLEAIQALQAVAEARQTYLAAVVDYNRAQLRLLRAIGRPNSSLQSVDAADHNG